MLIAKNRSVADAAKAIGVTEQSWEPDVQLGILFRRVREDVLAASQGRQDPILHGSLAGVALFLQR